jgi:polyisoprenoid-binding protein YceI
MKFQIPFLFAALATLFVVSCKNTTTEATTQEELPIETVATQGAADQVFKVVPASSKVHWEGYKPAMGVTHTGTVNVSEGTLNVKNGMLSGGSFVIDFTSLVDTDLEGERKAKLENHLKGTVAGKEDDFFNINKYPTGMFEITKVSAIEGDAEANTLIYGNLTIKDITKNVGFKANVDVDNNNIKATTPLFKLDRTEWDIKVLSKKFFPNLTDEFVDDEFGIRIELRADKGRNI